MSKLSLLRFLTHPSEVAHGIQRLGLRGATLHGVRRATASLERAMLGPAQLRINPMGAVCNHTCPMCWLQQMTDAERKHRFRADRADGMRLAEYELLLESVPPGLVEVNVVGGGEPLIHPDIQGIFAAIKRRGLRGYLISNGSLLDAELAAAMVAMSWDLVRVSTHAGDAATYAIVQGVDHFERIRTNLTEYDRARRAANKQRQCLLHVHHVIQRHNLETIPAMFEFGASVGADHVVFERVFALSPEIRLTRGELARAAELLAQGAARALVSSNALRIAAQLELEQADAPEHVLSTSHRPAMPEAAPADPTTSGRLPPALPPFRPANRCSVGFDSAFVSSNGDVLPCCFSTEVMGNVRTSKFSEVWFGERYAKFRKRLIRGEFADYCSNVRCNLRTFLHD